jgi:hypothetical protein
VRRRVLAAGLLVWIARRIPPSPSWPVTIAGWIFGESLHRGLRKIIKTRGAFPSDEAATKLLYLALSEPQMGRRGLYSTLGTLPSAAPKNGRVPFELCSGVSFLYCAYSVGSRIEILWNVRSDYRDFTDHSALIPADRMIVAHFASSLLI